MFEGVPYDIPVIGFSVNTVNVLRLWSSRAMEGFRLDVFNSGEYVKAVEEKNWAETITKVLYPADFTYAGKELRLLQEYFMVTCTIQDVIRRYRKKHSTWSAFAEKNAIQLNDTHPALGVAELMRYFLDETELTWDNAWEITTRTFGYTNHTLLPEALERWPVPLMERVLPRHLQIIYDINARFLN
jgi:glycogen phosphorylase